MLRYSPDIPFRRWASGARFKAPPSEPVVATIKEGYAGIMAEFWTNPVPVMTKRLLRALEQGGVTNLDTYRAEIHDPASGAIYHDHVAFNIIGVVSAADLKNSQFDPTQEDRKISMLFDAVAIDAGKAHDLLLFRLAESVNAIMVHQKVRQHIEASGIDTLTFVEPEDWAG
jgi:hypothetical protein